MELLKDPEVAKALEKQNDDELEKLLSPLDISDEDTMESLTQKQQKQLAKVVTYFNNKLVEVEKNAVAKAQQPEIAKREREITEFSKANPGMKNPEVVAIMQPLYDKGESLDSCYKKACRALELDPVTGEVPKSEKDEAKNKDKAKDKGVEKKKDIPKSSAKSSLSDDPDSTVGEEPEDKTGKSLDEIISANMNAYEAKNEINLDK